MRAPKHTTPFPELRAAWSYRASRDPAPRIYILSRVHGDPRFRPLRSPTAGQQLDKLLDAHTARSAANYARRWRCRPVQRTCAPWNDCPWLASSRTPVFSDRAVRVLDDLLRPHGYLLPLTAAKRRYYAFVADTLDGVLDLTQSSTERYGRIPRDNFIIRHHVFSSSKLAGHPIFRLRQFMSSTYVTQDFVDRVATSELEGFHFELVHPLPRTTTAVSLALRLLRKHHRANLPKGQSVFGQRVILRFMLDSENRIPSAREERKVNALAERLDQLLFDPRSTSVPVGAVEHVRPDTGECTITLRGPDAAKIERAIHPLVKAFNWPFETRLNRRRQLAP